jgi:hypothetical protein
VFIGGVAYNPFSGTTSFFSQWWIVYRFSQNVILNK